jgi:hypothetical protein
VRCFWNWRFLFRGKNAAEIRALLPATTQHLSHAVDIPMSPTLPRADCDDLIRAIRKVMQRRESSYADLVPRSADVVETAEAK